MSPIRDRQLWGARCVFSGLPAPDGACPCCDLHQVRIGADYGEERQ